MVELSEDNIARHFTLSVYSSVLCVSGLSVVDSTHELHVQSSDPDASSSLFWGWFGSGTETMH